MEEYTKDQLLKGDLDRTTKRQVSGGSDLEDVFPNGRIRDSKYYLYKTDNSNLILIERIKDND